MCEIPKKPWNQHFSNFFSKKKTLIWRKNAYLSVKKFRELYSLVMSQKIHGTNFLLKNYTPIWFDQKICMAMYFSFFQTSTAIHTMWKYWLLEFCSDLKNIFVKTNDNRGVWFSTKSLISFHGIFALLPNHEVSRIFFCFQLQHFHEFFSFFQMPILFKQMGPFRITICMIIYI